MDGDTHPRTVQHTNRLQNCYTNPLGYPQQIRDAHGHTDNDQITNTHQNRDADPYDDTHQNRNADPYRDANPNPYAHSDGDALVRVMKKTRSVLRGDIVAPWFFVLGVHLCGASGLLQG